MPARPARALLVAAAALSALAACGSDAPRPAGGAAPEPGPAQTAAPDPAAAAPPTTAPAITAAPVTTAPRPAPPGGLADVAEADGSIVVALNKLGSGNFTGAPLPGYEANRAFLQPEAVRALVRVQARLAPRGLGLKIYDAYRPARATRAMVEWARAQGRGDLVGPYIASVSWHNSGQAVDLTLVDRAGGGELDMGVPYETFDPRAHTANATGQAARNRSLLVEAMHAEAFENYPGEWWHFNYFVPGAALLDEPVR